MEYNQDELVYIYNLLNNLPGNEETKILQAGIMTKTKLQLEALKSDAAAAEVAAHIEEKGEKAKAETEPPPKAETKTTPKKSPNLKGKRKRSNTKDKAKVAK